MKISVNKIKMIVVHEESSITYHFNRICLNQFNNNIFKILYYKKVLY